MRCCPRKRLNQHHTDKIKLSLVLFDEMEKASDALWNLLLGILDKGVLTLGDMLDPLIVGKQFHPLPAAES
jgi:MoxR-like ATPase